MFSLQNGVTATKSLIYTDASSWFEVFEKSKNSASFHFRFSRRTLEKEEGSVLARLEAQIHEIWLFTHGIVWLESYHSAGPNKLAEHLLSSPLPRRR